MNDPARMRKNPSDSSHHNGNENPDEPDTQPKDDLQSTDNQSIHTRGAQVAGNAFRTAMEAVLNSIDNRAGPIKSRMTHTADTNDTNYSEDSTNKKKRC